MTQVNLTSVGSRSKPSASDILPPDRGHGYGLLHQSEEKFAPELRRSSIESEGIFIQVIVQIRCTHGSLMGALQPPLQQSSYSIHQGQQIFTYIHRWTDNNVLIVSRGQPSVASPAVGTYGTAWLHTFLYSRDQTRCGRICYSAKSNSPDTVTFIFSGYKNQRLTRCPSPSLSRPFATDIRFVNLHSARQTIPARPHYSGAKLMKPDPCGFISLEPQNPLESHGTDSVLLADNVPNRPKPQQKGFSRILKNRSCNYRGFILTSCAMIQLATGQPRLAMAATRAAKTIGPSKAEYVLQASLLRVKPLLKFHLRPWVVFHTQGS